MKVYTVIPLARTGAKETLTYFGPDTVPLGSLVSVPLRKKSVHAIVIEADSIEASKAKIKSSAFALKKIEKVVGQDLLSRPFLEAAHRTAHFYGTTTGAVLQAIVPKLVLETSVPGSLSKEVRTSGPKKEALVVQDIDSDRFAHYKSFIRSEFAKSKSVFFCLPTLEDIRKAKPLLEKGIESYTFTLHSSLTKKEFAVIRKRLAKESHPVLILATPPFLSVGRSDLGSIIIDRENSRSYRTQKRPFIDLKVFAVHAAEALKAKVVLGDLMLSVDTIWKQKNDEYGELSPLKFRMLTSAECLLVDLKLKRGEFEEDFRVLSRELEALIDKTIEDSERLFVFCGRKGLAPVTVCGDCGQVVSCKTCGAPVALYERGQDRVFMCNHCGTERDSAERCVNCDSWKLDTLGIGIERVEKEIRSAFPKAKIFRVDKESAGTEKKALALIKEFEATPGSILVGTELALLYLAEPVENITVASIDALFALPDFRINEKIFYMLLTMRTKAQKVFLIQTRNAGSRVFEQALKGNLIDFYRNEISEREELSYPPFSVFVKFTLEGKQEALDREIEALEALFSDFKPSVFASTRKSPRGNTLLHMLFRFKRNAWPDEKFLEKVRTLPPQILVTVDPESLL